MQHIVKAGIADFKLISRLAGQTFMESHGHSATLEEVNNYRTEKYNEGAVRKDLENERNLYYVIYHNECPAGYSKMILDSPYNREAGVLKIAKLERLYLLREFYGLGLGNELFAHNVSLAKEAGQTGVWLYVWKGNPRAIAFYRKQGFVINGDYDFRISETHVNPNHRMLLLF